MADKTLSGLGRLTLLLCIPYFWLVGRFWFVCEDAFITFRYSKNLAEGLGVRYNLGDHIPVEGYSNFLWMLIAAFFEFVGFDVTFWMPLISFGTGVWLLWMVVHTLNVRLGLSLNVTALGGLVFATFVPSAVWTTSGLATMPQTALMFAAFVRLAYGEGRRDFLLAGLFGLLLALVRTEGIAWAVVIAGVAFVSRLMRERGFRDALVPYFGVVLSGFTVYFAWRYSYYETVFSNTAHAKVDPSVQSLARGIQYVTYYAVLMVSPLLIVPAAVVGSFGKDRAHALGFAAMTVGVPTYALVVSGDYMAFFRMMVPGVPFMAVSYGFLFKWAVEKYQDQVPLITSLAVVTSILGVLPGYDIALAPERLINSVQTRLIKFESLEKDLSNQGLEVADRDEHLFGMGAEFHLRRPRNEIKRWKKMRDNPAKWRAEAEALKLVVEPDARVVTGAIGALGYYSNLYIYDQHGLVDGNVSNRREREYLRWPGHDKYVNKTYFLRREPEVLEFQIVYGSDAALNIAQIGEEFDKPAPREWYYPEVTAVEIDWPEKPAYVVLQKRAKSPVDAQEGWKRFDDEWGQQRGGKRRPGGRHKSIRSRDGESSSDIPGGRWRTLTNDPGLSAEEVKELQMLEAVGYLSGSVEASGRKTGVILHDPTRLQPGLTLYTSEHRASAVLADLDGKVLHRWSHRFNEVWSDYPVEKGHPGRSSWRRAYLQDDGALLAIYEGLGLIKIDKNSELVWKNPNRAHHDLDIDENGDIFVLTRVAHRVNRILEDKPILEDYVTVLDKDGVEKYSVSLLEAFERSDYEHIWRTDFQNKDIFHTSAIRVLDGRLADKLPAFKKGNVLLSMSSISALAVLDIEAEKIVWASKGDFEMQHDSKVLDNGNILVFNNSESSHSSALELDPSTVKPVWRFDGGEGRSFHSKFFGFADRLPNGNTLIVDSEHGHAFEVTKGGDIVWEFYSPHRVGPNEQFVATLLQATRLIDTDLSWLDDVEQKPERSKESADSDRKNNKDRSEGVRKGGKEKQGGQNKSGKGADNAGRTKSKSK